MPQRLEIYAHKVRSLGIFLLSCLLVGVSYFCTTRAAYSANVFGWIGVAFFSLGIIVGLRQLVSSRPLFIIDEQGLEERRSKLGLVEWADIREIGIREMNGQKFLCIAVIDPQKYHSRLNRLGRIAAAANQGMGFLDISLAFTGLTHPTAEVWQFIQSNPSFTRHLR